VYVGFNGIRRGESVGKTGLKLGSTYKLPLWKKPEKLFHFSLANGSVPAILLVEDVIVCAPRRPFAVVRLELISGLPGTRPKSLSRLIHSEYQEERQMYSIGMKLSPVSHILDRFAGCPAPSSRPQAGTGGVARTNKPVLR